MAANLALALDEIIKSQGKSPRPRGGAAGKRAGGVRRARTSATATARFSQRGFVSGEVPAGRWKHDKFMEVYGGSKRRAGGAGSSSGILKAVKGGGGSIGARVARKSSGGSSGMVKLQISNLPSTVVTSDLEELFQDYNVLGVTVHYDEVGSHLGTADMFTDQPTASTILRDFKNIAIDGQEIKFSLITEGVNASGSGGKKSIRDRLQRVSGGSNAIRKKVQVRKRVSGGPIKKSGRAAGGRRGVAAVKSSSTEKTKAKTAEELDMELETYMKKL